MANPETYAPPVPSTMSRRDREREESEREKIAETHQRDSSSMAPARAQQASVLLRSGTMWGLLYLPLLLAIAVLFYMLIHLRPGPGRVPGSGDRGSPNAQPGDR